MLSVADTASANDASALLYRIPRPASGPRPIWTDGHFGPIAAFQKALRARLSAINFPSAQLPSVDGQFGPGTVAALQALLKLPDFADLAPADGDNVGLTTAVWMRLLPGTPPPNVEQRIGTLTLTYEATPFENPAEWNFCQSVRASSRRTATTCLSNDPTSYLTWGPRGATAGGGREIQGVLIAVDSLNPSLANSAFGSEAASVRRFLQLGERRSPPVDMDTERFLCAVWLDSARADRWAQGFAALGAYPETRQIFFDLYNSPSFDGGKVAAFRRLYRALGHQPTEIDLAFFLDRATQTRGVFAAGLRANSQEAIERVASHVRKLVGDTAAVPAWRVRRALSVVLATQNQSADRNGRDVVFFVDGAGVSGLAAAELSNWKSRGPRFAEDLGLSDSRMAPVDASSGASYPTRLEPMGKLTAREAAQCPLRILNWINPHTGPRTPKID